MIAMVYIYIYKKNYIIIIIGVAAAVIDITVYLFRRPRNNNKGSKNKQIFDTAGKPIIFIFTFVQGVNEGQSERLLKCFFSFVYNSSTGTRQYNYTVFGHCDHRHRRATPAAINIIRQHSLIDVTITLYQPFLTSGQRSTGVRGGLF